MKGGKEAKREALRKRRDQGGKGSSYQGLIPQVWALGRAARHPGKTALCHFTGVADPGLTSLSTPAHMPMQPRWPKRVGGALLGGRGRRRIGLKLSVWHVGLAASSAYPKPMGMRRRRDLLTCAYEK
jgi:hypothetical protein